MSKWVFEFVKSTMAIIVFIGVTSLQAEQYVLHCDTYDTANTVNQFPTVQGDVVININHGKWLFFRDVPFQAGFNTIDVNYARKDSDSLKQWKSGFKMYVDSLADAGYEGDGTQIAECDLDRTSESSFYTFATATFPLFIPEPILGNHNLALTFYGGMDFFGSHVCNLKTITFYDSTDTTSASSRKTYFFRSENVSSSQPGRLLINLALQGNAARITEMRMHQTVNEVVGIYDVRGGLLGVVDPSKFNTTPDFLHNPNQGCGNRVAVPLESFVIPNK